MRIIATAALVALVAVPAAAEHGSTASSTSTTTTTTLLDGDVTGSNSSYNASVSGRVAAVQQALGQAGAELRNVSSSRHAEFVAAARQVRAELAAITRNHAKLDAAKTAQRRVDLQADIEGRFARIDVRLDHLKKNVPQLAAALSLDATTRARAAETYDSASGTTIADVQLSPRSAWGVTTMNRLSALEDRIDRIEAYAPRVSSYTSRQALRDAVYELRADLRSVAQSLQGLDEATTRSQWNRLHDDIEESADALTNDVDAAFSRWGVR